MFLKSAYDQFYLSVAPATSDTLFSKTKHAQMRKLLLLSWLCSFTLLASAQTRTLTGKVTDQQTGNPIPGATIAVKGTRQAASPGLDGPFTITVPSNAKTLLVSSVGYSGQEIAIGNNNVLNIGITS